MAGLSGCSGLLGGDGTPEQTLTPVDVRPTAAETATPTPAVTRPVERRDNGCDVASGQYHPDRPPLSDLPEPSERFRSLSCPSFSWGAETVCQHTADISREPVVLVSERDTAVVPADGDDDSLSFVLVTRREGQVRIQPSAWSLVRPSETPTEWTVVASGAPGCTRTLDDGGYHRWRVGIDRTVLAPAANATAVQASLDPGVYRFVVPVVRPNGRDVVCVAPFAVRDGDPEGITPTTPTSGSGTGYGNTGEDG
jgi:hypothetical protein